MDIQLETNKVHFGDCLVLMQDIPDKSVDMILCDLPYGTTKCKWDVVIPFEPLWKQYNRIIKDNGIILLFGSEPFASTLRLSNLKMYKYDYYWNKKRGANFLFANKQPFKIIETISVFYKKQPTYNPQKRDNPLGAQTKHLHKNSAKISKNVKSIMGESWKETEQNNGENYAGKNYEPDKLLPTCLVEFVKDTKRIHPTQKPLELYEYLIRTHTNEGDLVLDNCAGSCTTAIACINTKRNWICMENNQEYYNAGLQRINEHNN